MNNAIKGHLCVVFAQEHYNPLGMIRGLGINGVNPIYISVKRRGEVATKSKYISKLHRVDSVEEGYKLLFEKYGYFDFNHRPFVLFSDDKCIGYFDERFDEVKNKFIVYNANRSNGINFYMNKFNIQQLAKKHGFKILKSYVVEKGEIPDDLIFPIITKDISPNSGAWKSDVFICENKKELIDAFDKIESSKILLQRYINKKNEIALQGYSINDGKDIHIITAMDWKYLIKGYYSPYHNVYPFNNCSIESKLKAMFSEIGFNGIFEVEFLIDQDEIVYFTEINFRASAWNHTTNYAGMAESYLWVKGMIDGKISAEDRKIFDSFTSMSEIIDYGKRVDTGIISLQEWIRDFKKAKCTYYYNEEDMGPFEYVADKWDEYK